MVLPKPSDLPGIVTAGGDTWAVRVPDHAVTHSLLLEAGPLAAPSANVSSAVSPTTAEHVLAGLDGRIDMVLDGGPCAGGIESTVIDLTASPPRVLRPGPVRPSELRRVVGEVVIADLQLADEVSRLPSPGTSIRHYAPRATLECYRDNATGAERVETLQRAGQSVAWLQRMPADPPVQKERCLVFTMPSQAASYATVLYDTLHGADRAGVEYIILDLPPDTEEWLAVRDRLHRAARLWNE
jgi:L-threonylcarbamoyladenylate synthase